MLWLLPLLPGVCGAALWAAAPRSRAWLGGLAVAALATTLLLAALAAPGGWSGRIDWAGPLVLTAALPPMAAAMAMLVPAIALPIALYAAAHEAASGLARLVGLLLVFVGGMQLLVVAADLLTLLIGWELVGACSWALIAHRWRDAEPPAAGRYAFVTTRLGDLGLFLAAMAAFAGTGSFAYAALPGLEGPALQLFAFGILLSAAAKSGQVPFSPWLFRAMAGPTSVSALLHAATMVAAGAYLLIRLHPVLAEAPGFSAAAVAVGLVTALAGGIAAVLQGHAKKLLAASTSAQYGLMFVAVGAGYPLVALLHLGVHAAFKALLFLAAGLAERRAGTFALTRLGLGRALPWTALASAGAALALAGVPPFAGAWTKEAVVSAAHHTHLWAAGAAMLAGGLSAAYAARFQILAFAPRPRPPGRGAPDAAERAAVALLLALVLFLSALWLPAVQGAAARLLGGEIPALRPGESTVSLLLVALGLAAGTALARRAPTYGTGGGPARAAEWLGLPRLIQQVLVQPFERLCAAAAQVDDAVLDALPRTAARVGPALARRLGLADERAVDAGVEATAAGARGFARLSDRLGEAVADGLPEASARLVALGGADARKLQTGLSHHYYALLSGGAFVLVAALLLLSRCSLSPS
jgi:NADH:ubiquinone oxidoreductase subunit 5 (subunit L)/multisubunit Na+/H+ antiporter MnhA subunit